ncbi:hypothetical protein OKW26_003089 [Paraburkholderia sp. 32]
MTVGGRKNSVTRCFAIAARRSAGSGLGNTTTVPPRAVHGSESIPAVCVMGAAARFTGRSTPYGNAIMNCAK